MTFAVCTGFVCFGFLTLNKAEEQKGKKKQLLFPGNIKFITYFHGP